MINNQTRDLTAPFWTLTESAPAKPTAENVFDYLARNPSEKNQTLLNELLRCVAHSKNDPTGASYLDADKPMLYEVWFFWFKQFDATSWQIYRNKNKRGAYVTYGFGCSAVWKNVRLCLSHSYISSNYYKRLSSAEKTPIYGLD